MKTVFWFLLVAFCFLLSSCGNSPYPDFTETRNKLYYKIEDIGDGEQKARSGDYITAQIVIKSDKDSLLFDTQKMGPEGAVTFILPPIEYEKDYREGYLYLSEGDSASFITDAHALFMKKNRSVVPRGMSLETPIRIQTKVLRIRTQQEHEKEMQEEKAKLERGEFEEKKLLDKYLTDSAITVSPVFNGMYYIKLTEGSGLTPDSGRVALLNYKGCFLNGRCFDTSFETQPFEYIICAEEQLIPGLTAGVRRMHEGERAKFIIPSHLAFGSSGSSTGIVPPFTTVIYEVELLKVQ
jgi:peptidylprolyl isomerase